MSDSEDEFHDSSQNWVQPQGNATRGTPEGFSNLYLSRAQNVHDTVTSSEASVEDPSADSSTEVTREPSREGYRGLSRSLEYPVTPSIFRGTSTPQSIGMILRNINYDESFDPVPSDAYYQNGARVVLPKRLQFPNPTQDIRLNDSQVVLDKTNFHGNKKAFRVCPYLWPQEPERALPKVKQYMTYQEFRNFMDKQESHLDWQLLNSKSNPRYYHYSCKERCGAYIKYEHGEVTHSWYHDHILPLSNLIRDHCIKLRIRVNIFETFRYGFSKEESMDFGKPFSDLTKKEQAYFKSTYRACYQKFWYELQRDLVKSPNPSYTLKDMARDLSKESGWYEFKDDYGIKVPKHDTKYWTFMFSNEKQLDILRDYKEEVYFSLLPIDMFDFQRKEKYGTLARLYTYILMTRDLVASKELPLAFLITNSLHVDGHIKFWSTLKETHGFKPSFVVIDCSVVVGKAIEHVYGDPHLAITNKELFDVRMLGC